MFIPPCFLPAFCECISMLFGKSPNCVNAGFTPRLSKPFSIRPVIFFFAVSASTPYEVETNISIPDTRSLVYPCLMDLSRFSQAIGTA